ncbi:hypothetical protein ACROYT_G027580, partial [Oculina patagonica]
RTVFNSSKPTSSTFIAGVRSVLFFAMNKVSFSILCLFFVVLVLLLTCSQDVEATMSLLPCPYRPDCPDYPGKRTIPKWRSEMVRTRRENICEVARALKCVDDQKYLKTA